MLDDNYIVGRCTALYTPLRTQLRLSVIPDVLPLLFSRTLVCGHTFHSACIDQWVLTGASPRCPLCRRMVLPLHLWDLMWFLEMEDWRLAGRRDRLTCPCCHRPQAPTATNGSLRLKAQSLNDCDRVNKILLYFYTCLCDFVCVCVFVYVFLFFVYMSMPDQIDDLSYSLRMRC